MADRTEQSTVVEPVDPIERRTLDVVDVGSMRTTTNDFGLVQPNDELRKRVLVGVPDTADGWLDAASASRSV